jgi:exodeoxyribonuclease VII small subunit
MPGKNTDQRKGGKAEREGTGFEKRLERLEQLAARLREGSMPLEEAVALFEEGMKLSRTLEKELARVERRVEILTGDQGEAADPADEDDESDGPALELFPELGEEEKG